MGIHIQHDGNIYIETMQWEFKVTQDGNKMYNMEYVLSHDENSNYEQDIMDRIFKMGICLTYDGNGMEIKITHVVNKMH